MTPDGRGGISFDATEVTVLGWTGKESANAAKRNEINAQGLPVGSTRDPTIHESYTVFCADKLKRHI